MKITPSELKRINKNKVFQLIYNKKVLKRQDIADELSLSLPTVNQNLRELIEDGFVEFSGEFVSTGGRKPQVIVPIADAKYTIALNIRKNYIRLVLVDFLGEVVKSKREDVVFDDNKDYSAKLSSCVDLFIQECKVPRDKVLGVGITIPGIFDKESEKIIIAPTLGVRDFDINKLTTSMAYRTIVVNDARASAFTYVRKNDDVNNAVYLLVDGGVGGCIIENGKLLKGTNNRAGEIGHMTIVMDGKKCSCGKNGCLESYVAISTIKDENITDDYLKYLAIGISNIYTIFDRTIVIGGGLADILEKDMERLKDMLKIVNPIFFDGIDIKIDAHSKKEALTGAALMLIEDYIRNI